MPLCSYGCGQEAKFYSKYSKKWRCSRTPGSCPAQRQKNSERSLKREFVKRGGKDKIKEDFSGFHLANGVTLCYYSCGQEAKHQLKNGKWCCSKSWNSCPANRKKNSATVKEAHVSGRKGYTYNPKSNWAQGKTAFSDPRIKANYKPEEVFIYGSSIDTVRRVIKQEGLLPYKCAKCGITSWKGKQLSLHLHHKNNDHYDNRLENLIFLCPNCHSIADHSKSKQRQGRKKVTDEELVADLKQSKSIYATLKRFGFGDSDRNYERMYVLIEKHGLQPLFSIDKP